MSIDRFLAPKLTGSRFDGHAIPLEFLKDLAVLEDLILEVAKLKFLEDYPGRKRSPRGWTDGVELKLTNIEDGSSVAVISLMVAAGTLFPPHSQVYFEKSRDAVVQAISAAEQNQSAAEFLPEQTLTYFDKIGRSLRDDEAIEFRISNTDRPARLTKETRRRILLSSNKVEELTDEIDVWGSVFEVDQVKMTFQIELIDGGKVTAPIVPQHLETILEATTGYRSGTRVLVKGIGRFSRTERLLSMESIQDINILDSLDVPARLEELRTLEDNWLEGRGIAPSKSGLDWFSRVFDQRYPEDLRLPFIYPTETGDIRAEWSIGRHEISVDIDLNTHAAKWHAVDMNEDTDKERVLDLDDSADWDWLTKRLEELGGSAE